MSYIESSLSPYRSDIKKEVKEILSEDYEWVCSSLTDRGLIFGMAFVSIMGISLLKAGCHVINQLGKPRMTYDHLALARSMHADTMLSKLSRREAIDELENHDAYCSDETKTQRADSINTLRTYLYSNDLTLHATTLETIDYDCTEDEIKEMYRKGKITKPLFSSHVTFGNDLDLMIKDVLKDKIDLKKDDSGNTYFEVTNNDFSFLKSALLNLYNEEIQIQFD